MGKNNNFFKSDLYQEVLDEIKSLGYTKRDAIFVYDGDPSDLNKKVYKVSDGLGGDIEQFYFDISKVKFIIDNNYVITLDTYLPDYGGEYNFTITTNIKDLLSYDKHDVVDMV